jgi:ferredoxin
MIGENTFQDYKYITSKEVFLKWINYLKDTFSVIGPVRGEKGTSFRQIDSLHELSLEYSSTMLPPGKIFIYEPYREICSFIFSEDIIIKEPVEVEKKQILLGVHPCDTCAILYLDKTFLGLYKDKYYEERRKNTLIISLNCSTVLPECFCSSVGTGPFLKDGSLCDILLTEIDGSYLIEIESAKGKEIFNLRSEKATKKELKKKLEKEADVKSSIKKFVDLKNLDEVFSKSMSHKVWKEVADERCLSCCNCVMVCPTCFCYEIFDMTSMDLKSVKRFRRLDACQDVKFAEVHGGNFRQKRSARLRQFVTHKMNQTWQYGMYGTVGCGRCIRWCPTHIDLTEITKEIQRGLKVGK